jgi:CRISPR-associated endonuclease/helicase Cas3
MSATLDPALLATPDFAPYLDLLHVFRIAPDEVSAALARRLEARKSVARAPVECRTPEGLARFVAREHRPGSQTLVVVNRVERAIEVYGAIEEFWRDTPGHPELLLLHSRFRPNDRKEREESLDAASGDKGRIIISTQVIEAGIDITSELLITDLAPYASLVQRFGRCNRDGRADTARIFWIDRPLTARQSKLAEQELPDAKQLEEIARPYWWAELEEAAQLIAPLRSAAPVDLPPYKATPSQDHVLRRRDLMDLFDTSRDLSGFDIDISRFVRGGEEHDVFVAWRAADEKGLLRTAGPERDELCPVPIGEVREFLRKASKSKPRRAWFWDGLDGAWLPASPANLEACVRPGSVLLLDSAAGGYDSCVGWSPASAARVVEVPPAGESKPEDSMDADHGTIGKYRQTLAAHSSEVREALGEMLRALANSEVDPYEADLLYAALHHDIGKAHRVFQGSLRGDEGRLLAKDVGKKDYSRPHFRHELASALALLSAGASDLAAYLAAAHHGKVRLAIRSLPGEQPPDDPEVRFARGIHEGDRLPEIGLGEARFLETVLQLEPMLLGGSEQPSWTERMIRLRDGLGPFRLAYLEALLRVADWRASEHPKETEAS